MYSSQTTECILEAVSGLRCPNWSWITPSSREHPSRSRGSCWEKVSSCLSGINGEECRGTVKTRDLTEPRVLSSQGYSTGLSFYRCIITRGRRSRGFIGFLCEGSPSGYWSKASQSPCTSSPRRGGVWRKLQIHWSTWSNTGQESRRGGVYSSVAELADTVTEDQSLTEISESRRGLAGRYTERNTRWDHNFRVLLDGTNGIVVNRRTAFERGKRPHRLGHEKLHERKRRRTRLTHQLQICLRFIGRCRSTSVIGTSREAKSNPELISYFHGWYIWSGLGGTSLVLGGVGTGALGAVRTREHSSDLAHAPNRRLPPGSGMNTWAALISFFVGL